MHPKKGPGRIRALIAAIAIAISAPLWGSMVAAKASPATASFVPAAQQNAPGAGHFAHTPPPGAGAGTSGKAAAGVPGSGFYYVGGQQIASGTNTAAGLQAGLQVTAPYTDTAHHDHSLIEIAVSRDNTAGSDTYEFGVVANALQNGDSTPRMFVYFWKNGAPGGCYWSCSSWVDKTPTVHTDDPGADMSAVAGAAYPGAIKTFRITFESPTTCGASINTGNWNYYYAGTLIGCFPPSTTPGFGANVTRFDVFGEVFYGGTTKPCTDMGKLGRFGSTYVAPGDDSDPAIAASASLVNATGGMLTNLSLYATDSTLYDYVNLSAPGTNVRTFALGGPAADSSGNLPGVANGC